MSSVTPEFLEQYNYIMNIINQTAAENRVAWAESKEEFQQWKIKQAKRDLEYDQMEKRLIQQERNYGRFTEGFVRHQLVRLLGDWGIKVTRFHPNVEAYLPDGTKREFDAIAVNGDTVVFVEVKSTLQQNETEYFLAKMKQIRDMFPEYKDKKIIAAIAYINDAEGAVKMAQNCGLLTILGTASSARITNPAGFQPAVF